MTFNFNPFEFATAEVIIPEVFTRETPATTDAEIQEALSGLNLDVSQMTAAPIPISNEAYEAIGTDIATVASFPRIHQHDKVLYHTIAKALLTQSGHATYSALSAVPRSQLIIWIAQFMASSTIRPEGDFITRQALPRVKACIDLLGENDHETVQYHVLYLRLGLLSNPIKAQTRNELLL